MLRRLAAVGEIDSDLSNTYKMQCTKRVLIPYAGNKGPDHSFLHTREGNLGFYPGIEILILIRLSYARSDKNCEFSHV